MARVQAQLLPDPITPSRWTTGDLEVLFYLCVHYLEGTGFSAAIRRILEEVNHKARSVPNLTGYAKRAYEQGHLVKSADWNQEDFDGKGLMRWTRVQRLTLTPEGEAHMDILIAQLNAADLLMDKKQGAKLIRAGRIGPSKEM